MPVVRFAVRAHAHAVATLVLAGTALAPPLPANAETHRLVPSVGHPTFAVREPVLTVKPGDVVESETLWGEWYEKAGGKWPGEVGPIALEGAQPGDTLYTVVAKFPKRQLPAR